MQKHGYLGVSKNRIVNQDGQNVVLRGMSLFWSQWQPHYFTYDTLRWLRDDWGITVIRAPLGIHHQGYLENPALEKAKIETVIEAAIQLGIYVVVDWHAYIPEPERAATFFGEIARKYGSFPNIIYEPWNEPTSEYDWQAIKRYHMFVVARIREHDLRNIVIAGTQNWCRDVEVAANDPLPFRNIGYALHFYAASHGQALRDKAERALNMGTALMVTEWGACREDGDGPVDRAEVKQWWKFLERNEISHINWAVGNRPETSAALNPHVRSRDAWLPQDISESGHLIRRQLRRAR